jgi:hypothetical protein
MEVKMCEHHETKKVETSREVAGLLFEYETKECIECKSQLWSQALEKKFVIWLSEQKDTHIEKFTIQKVRIPSKLAVFAEKLAREAMQNESVVYRCAIGLYYRWTDKIETRADKKESRKSTLDFRALELPKYKEYATRKFRVNPLTFIRIEADAKLFGLPTNQAASWIIERVLWAACEGQSILDNEAALSEMKSLIGMAA